MFNSQSLYSNAHSNVIDPQSPKHTQYRYVPFNQADLQVLLGKKQCARVISTRFCVQNNLTYGVVPWYVPVASYLKKKTFWGRCGMNIFWTKRRCAAWAPLAALWAVAVMTRRTRIVLDSFFPAFLSSQIMFSQPGSQQESCSIQIYNKNHVPIIISIKAIRRIQDWTKNTYFAQE